MPIVFDATLWLCKEYTVIS